MREIVSTTKCGSTLSDSFVVAIINRVRKFRASISLSANPANRSAKQLPLSLRGERASKRGQVAQVVERSPEKAGVGGSTPSLATINSKHLAAKSRNLQPTIQPMILT